MATTTQPRVIRCRKSYLVNPATVNPKKYPSLRELMEGEGKPAGNGFVSIPFAPKGSPMAKTFPTALRQLNKLAN